MDVSLVAAGLPNLLGWGTAQHLVLVSHVFAALLPLGGGGLGSSRAVCGILVPQLGVLQLLTDLFLEGGKNKDKAETNDLKTQYGDGWINIRESNALIPLFKNHFHLLCHLYKMASLSQCEYHIIIFTTMLVI